MTIPQAEPHELDVRPLLHAGQEPFAAIMAAVDGLARGQALRLIAPFRPVPLYKVMANRGYGASERALPGSDWEVVFTPKGAMPVDTGLAAGSSPSAAGWKSPIEELDLRELDPPEPMVRILDTLGMLEAGDVLFALLSREPLFLFPELAKRGHEWAGNFDTAGRDYRLLIRHGEDAS